jgi:hypothetical protein
MGSSSLAAQLVSLGLLLLLTAWTFPHVINADDA